MRSLRAPIGVHAEASSGGIDMIIGFELEADLAGGPNLIEFRDQGERFSFGNHRLAQVAVIRNESQV